MTQNLRADNFIPNAGPLGYVPLATGESLGNIASFAYPVGYGQRYGVKGDGTTDDVPAINFAAAALTGAGGGILYLPPPISFYKLSSGPINLPSNVKLLLGSSTTEIRQVGAFPAVQALGTFAGYYTTITADMVLGAYTASVGAGASYSAGQVVWVQQQTDGEAFVNIIRSYVGTVITFWHPIVRAFTVANNTRIVVMTTVVRPSIEGGKITTTLGQIAIYLKGCEAVSVVDCEVTGGRHGISGELSINGHISRIRQVGSGTVGPDGPGIGLTSCQSFTIEHHRSKGQLTDEPIVLFKNCQDIFLIDNQAEGCVGAGHQIDSWNNHIYLIASRIHKCGNIGIYNVSGTAGRPNRNVHIINPVVTDAGTDAINCTGVIGGSITNPTTSGQAGWGVKIDATSVGVRATQLGGLAAVGSGAFQDLQAAPPTEVFAGALQAYGLAFPNFVSDVGASGIPARAVYVNKVVEGFVSTAWTTSWTPAVDTGNVQELVASTSGVAYAVQPPTGGAKGQLIKLWIKITSAGVLGAATFNAVFKMAPAWVNPASGFRRYIAFRADGISWVEEARSPVDIPN